MSVQGWARILAFVQLFFLIQLVDCDLVNSKVSRKIDLSTHLPKITISITVENADKKPHNAYHVAVPEVYAPHVASITAKKSTDAQLNVNVESGIKQSGAVLYRVGLDNSLEAGQSVSFEVEIVLSHVLQAYPAEIVQAERQLMKFNDNLFLFSPYTTNTQTTTVVCTNSNLESYTKISSKVSENTITYGPFENKEPFSQEEMVIHYENNSPFLAVTNLNRVIEVSHWGNIAVEETIDISHYGAKLRGPFSRFDYQRSQDGVSSVKSFKTILPASAKDVYYRDEIGNISTSNLREIDGSIEVELRPRFPLFGGWKTHYVIGYNVPSYQYLFNTGDDYKLKMRFLDHIYDDQVVDQMTVKIILPEKTGSVQFSAPFPVKRLPDEVHKTYLDTTGRPVIIVHKQNLVENHIQDFELRYEFSKLMLLQEPLIVVAVFYILFLTIIIYVRLDFSITKDEASESRMRVASLIEQIQGIQDRRSALYQSYDDAINKFKSSKDATVFNTNRKKIDTDHKTLTQQISSLLSKLKSEGTEISDKVVELQQLDTQMKEQIGSAINYAERLLSNKLNKSQYLEHEVQINAKREELCTKMEALLSTL